MHTQYKTINIDGSVTKATKGTKATTLYGSVTKTKATKIAYM